MFLAIAALLLQPQIAPQLSFSAEKTAVIQPVATADNAAVSESSLPPVAVDADTVVAGTSAQPVAEASANALPATPAPASEVNSPVPELILAKPLKPMTVSVSELRAENRRNERLWTGLALASHSAATFDAWSTRHAITTYGDHEMNPLLRPFAGNASLFLAIQVGPTVMDYLGKKMMYSRNSWVRHMWWVPQSASFVSSVFCGAHNLAVN
jgi:hypothetical protein